MVNCSANTSTADDLSTPRDQSTIYTPPNPKILSKKATFPGAQITSPSLTHCALLMAREPLDTAMVKIIALLVGMSFEMQPK